MDIREQVENDLRIIASGSVSDSTKKNIEKVIYQLKSTELASFKIKNKDDPFVIAYKDISMSKRQSIEYTNLISTIRLLIENEILESPAIQLIFEDIAEQIQSNSDNFCLKVLQIALSLFSSKIGGLNDRISVFKWTLLLLNSTSEIVKQVSIATLYQLIDITYERASSQHNIIKSSQSVPQDLNIEEENKSTDKFEISEATDWSILFLFSFIKDIISVLHSEPASCFSNEFSTEIVKKILPDILKYVLDKNHRILALYQTEYSAFISKLCSYVSQHKENIIYLQFVPFIIIFLSQINPPKAQQYTSTLINMVDSNPVAFSALSISFLLNSSIQFSLISGPDLVELSKKACKFVLANFKGHFTNSIVISGKNKPNIDNYDPKSITTSKIINSCIEILYLQIPQCIHHLEHFDQIFDSFETIWQRVVNLTEDQTTLLTSMKISRVAVKIAIAQSMPDPVNRILSTLCGLSLPQSSAYSLTLKSVISLSSITRLFSSLTYRLIKFWPLILETISKCYHTASHRRSAADVQALTLISPNLFDFSEEISDDPFISLFSILIKLSENEKSSFISNKGTVANFWPLKILSNIFTLNIERINLIEQIYFDHLKDLIECESKEFRIQAVVEFFIISKILIKNKESSSRIFDFMQMTTCSSFKDVSITAFSCLLNFLTGETSNYIEDNWPVILTTLKAVWSSTNKENIDNGFRTLNYICRDCMKLIGPSSIQILMSTVSSYISQDEDINTALGGVGLFWDIGSEIVPISSESHQNAWKTLLETLEKHFHDNRQNVRIASLETFFNLVSTFSPQFPSNLIDFVITDVFIPLYNRILSDSQNQNFDLSNKIESFLLSLQNGIQCLYSLGNYQEVMPLIIKSAEVLSLRSELGNRCVDFMKCFIQLCNNNDKNLYSAVTKSIDTVVRYYCKNLSDAMMQGAANVVSEILPKIANSIDDGEFAVWLGILDVFCTFQVDKPFLNLATHVSLNTICQLHDLTIERMSFLVQLILSLFTIRHQPLTTKCFEVIETLYTKSFNEENRWRCLELVLPIFLGLLLSTDCMTCLKKMFELEINLSTFFVKNINVRRFVDLGRRFDDFKELVITKSIPYMEFISPTAFSVYLSLQSVDVVAAFFENICCDGCNDSKLAFANQTKSFVYNSLKEQVELIISEEKALGSILPKSRYSGIINLLDRILNIHTDDRIFSSRGFHTQGHIFFVIDLMVKLTDSQSSEIRTAAQKIILSCQQKE